MNPLTPFTDRSLGNLLQTHVDPDTLISLSTASHDTFRIYRPWLMHRIVTEFNLDMTISINDLHLYADVWKLNSIAMSALQQRITEETEEIHQEMDSQDAGLRSEMNSFGLTPMPEGNVRVRRLDLRTKITAFCHPRTQQPANMFTSRINSPAFLHFLLSSTERMVAINPQNSKARQLNAAAIGRMLQIGQVTSGRLLHAWNRLNQEWPTLNACKQAELLVPLSIFLQSITQEPSHQALPFVQKFIGNRALGWAHEVMRRGYCHVIESQETDELNRQRKGTILAVLADIANTSSLCQHKAVLDVSCETIQQLLDCPTQDAVVNVRQAYGGEATITYIRNNLARMTPQEQIAVLLSLKTSPIQHPNGAELPLLPSLRALVQDDRLAWAHEAIPRCYSHIIEVHNAKAERTLTKVAELQAEILGVVCNRIVEAPQSKQNFEDDFATILRALDCTTEAGLESLKQDDETEQIKIKLVLTKQNWGRMNTLEQAAAFADVIFIFMQLNNPQHPEVPFIREFLADETLVCENAATAVRKACCYVLEAQPSERVNLVKGLLQGFKISDKRWQESILVHLENMFI